MEERFTWLDWTEDTASLLAALDVFVSASHTESFGLAILEAMAIGCAIVATGTEGANELLQSGVSGKIVSMKDPARLADAVGALLSDENLRQTFGVNAQARAKEKFGLDRMIGETEIVYREISPNN
jgi:glycosyltransferase involved in cell wall biosynthesis